MVRFQGAPSAFPLATRGREPESTGRGEPFKDAEPSRIARGGGLFEQPRGGLLRGSPRARKLATGLTGATLASSVLVPVVQVRFVGMRVDGPLVAVFVSVPQ